LSNSSEASMVRCQVYGTTEAHQALVDEIFVINGKYVLVEGIPASICTWCGEATFSRETTGRIRRMVKRNLCAPWLWRSLPTHKIRIVASDHWTAQKD